LQPNIPSGSRWTREGDAQRAYLLAAQSLKDRGEIDDYGFHGLLCYRPLGIDAEGRVVLEYPSAEVAEAEAATPVFVRLARAISEGGLAKGLAHKVARPSRAHPPRRRILYMPEFLTSLTLPHSRVEGAKYTRVNGNRKLSLLAAHDSGLPYGIYPRLALIHLTTEALLCRQRTFYVGTSANDFLAQMGVHDSGGERGTATRAREQLRRLCLTLFAYHDTSQDKGDNIVVADKWVSWPGHGMQVTLGENFFSMASQSSVPLDPAIVNSLRRSPLALDAYAWLTYRVKTLKRETVVPWRSLEIQFGADYTHARNFRLKFRRALAAIQELWIGVEVEPLEKGLLVRQCAQSVLSWLERAGMKG